MCVQVYSSAPKSINNSHTTGLNGTELFYFLCHLHTSHSQLLSWDGAMIPRFLMSFVKPQLTDCHTRCKGNPIFLLLQSVFLMTCPRLPESLKAMFEFIIKHKLSSLNRRLLSLGLLQSEHSKLPSKSPWGCRQLGSRSSRSHALIASRLMREASQAAPASPPFVHCLVLGREANSSKGSGKMDNV